MSINAPTYNKKFFVVFFVGKATAWAHKTKFELNLAKNWLKMANGLCCRVGKIQTIPTNTKRTLKMQIANFALKQGRPRHHVTTKEKHVEHPRVGIGRVAKNI